MKNNSHLVDPSFTFPFNGLLLMFLCFVGFVLFLFCCFSQGCRQRGSMIFWPISSYLLLCCTVFCIYRFAANVNKILIAVEEKNQIFNN